MAEGKAKVRWTDEQQAVIDHRNGNLLVSAAAGSGKTAVLIEHILSLVCSETDPRDIDRLLHRMARLIALSVNLALHPQLSFADAEALG